jgi:plasmid maintenance system antidote protein VapI
MRQHFPPSIPFPLTREGLREFFAQYAHWTHEGFAARVGVNQRTMRRILEGTRQIGPRTRDKILRKFSLFFTLRG